jgi:hypothetical protein
VRAAILLLCTANAVLVTSHSSNAASRIATYSHAGLTVTVPAGWHVVGKRITPCVNPLERVTLAGRGAQVTLMETLDPRRYVQRFPLRPQRFALGGTPERIACCAPLDRRGWFFAFRDHDRGFYTFIYLGKPGTRREALGILDTVRVGPRGA